MNARFRQSFSLAFAFLLMLTFLPVQSAQAISTVESSVGQLASQPSSAAAPRYTVTDLGTLGGSSRAYGINDEDQVVGMSYLPGGNPHAFLWEDGVMTDLGTLGGYGSEARDINNAGQIVGMASTPSISNRAFLWQNGAMQNLGTLGGNGSDAFGINSSGQVVGFSGMPTGPSHAFLWQNGSMQDLGDFGTGAAAYDINDAGQAVGDSCYPTASPCRAFLWQGGPLQDLGHLGGDTSRAYAINKASQVVGESHKDNGEIHPFLWQNGAMQDLGTLSGPGSNDSHAYDINDDGQVVGGSAYHAFLWENGQMQDLNNLIPANSGWVLLVARAINNKGQIVGYGVINGQTHAYLLTLTATFRSTGANDGWILESTETSNAGGTMNVASTTFNLGDDAADKQYRAILHFDTSSLPNTAVITKATLKIKRQGLVGVNPFTTLGKVAVDIRKGAFGNNSALQLTDFQSAAHKNNAGLIYNAPVGNWYSAVFPSATFSYINLMGVTQFRLRFQTDDNNNSVADYLRFFSGDYATAGARPTFIIEYYVP